VWAKCLLCLEAAVELLIGNRSWLFREDFLEIAVEFGWDGRYSAASRWRRCCALPVTGAFAGP